MLQVFQRGAQMTGLNAALSIIRAIKPPVAKDMQYTGAGESKHWFQLHKQNFLSPFYTELTFLMELASCFPSWRNQRAAPPWVRSNGMVVNQKNLCLYSLLPHTQIFSIQHYLKHYFRNCFWAEPCNTLRQWKRGRWLSKGAGVKQTCSASLCFQLLHCKCHSKCYSWLALSFGACWMG